MPGLSPLEALAPPEMVAAARNGDEREFLTLYGDTLFLVITVDPELASGLAATALRGSEGVPPVPVAASMDFHTAVQPLDALEEIAATTPQRDDPEKLSTWLERGAHFAAPLRKRAGADATYRERISIGRARNKDIVLRNPSVSKFHAWFEVDEVGGFHLADAGSKNGTRVNGTVLGARERTPVEPGDGIQFGVVDAVLCSPRAFRAALRGSAKGRG